MSATALARRAHKRAALRQQVFFAVVAALVEGEREAARFAGEAVLYLGAVAEDLFGGVELVQADGLLGGLVKQVLYQVLLRFALEFVVHHLPGRAA